jgi:osmotically-inducible protein OsmY
LLSAVGCAPTPTREGTGEYVEDSVITAKVKTAILAEPGLKSAEINVETFKGTVQLSGFVKEESDKRRAGEVTRQVKGVQSVKNDIRLK